VDARFACGRVGVRGGYRYQLFGLRGRRTVGKHALVEGTKSRCRPWGQAPSLFGELAGRGRKELFTMRHP
jgi:hypothetical protein